MGSPWHVFRLPAMFDAHLAGAISPGMSVRAPKVRSRVKMAASTNRRQHAAPVENWDRWWGFGKHAAAAIPPPSSYFVMENSIVVAMRLVFVRCMHPTELYLSLTGSRSSGQPLLRLCPLLSLPLFCILFCSQTLTSFLSLVWVLPCHLLRIRNQ